MSFFWNMGIATLVKKEGGQAGTGTVYQQKDNFVEFLLLLCLENIEICPKKDITNFRALKKEQMNISKYFITITLIKHQSNVFSP